MIYYALLMLPGIFGLLLSLHSNGPFWFLIGSLASVISLIMIEEKKDMPIRKNGHLDLDRDIILCMHWQEGHWHITSPEIPTMMIVSDTLSGAFAQITQSVEKEFGNYGNAN